MQKPERCPFCQMNLTDSNVDFDTRNGYYDCDAVANTS